MNRYQSTVAAIAFVAALWPVRGSAQGLENERSLAVTVGTGVSLSGNVIEEGAGPINGTPSVFVEQAYSNHFSDALRLRVTGGMGLDYNKEAFLSFAYDKINGTERVTGSSGGYPLYTRSATPRRSTSKVASATTSCPKARHEPTLLELAASVSTTRSPPPSGCSNWV